MCTNPKRQRIKTCFIYSLYIITFMLSNECIQLNFIQKYDFINCILMFCEYDMLSINYFFIKAKF